MLKTISAAALLCALVYVVYADEASVWRKAKTAGTQGEHRAALRELYELRGSVNVYGRVLDQWGNAVANADVRVSWHSADWMLGRQNEHHETFTKTDCDGLFEVALDHPHEATAYASKDGYESIRPGSSASKLIGNRTTKETPAMLCLRKKGTPAFLIVSPSGNSPYDTLIQTKGTNSVSRPLDLLAWNGNTQNGWRNSATTNADLRIDAAFDADKKCWNLTYSVTNGPGGIVLTGRMLYEAPADGYAPSVSVTVTNVYDWHRYLYVKSRTPALYSRVLFVHGARVGADPSLRVSCKAWVNPYGERNLEADERVTGTHWRTREELTAEAIQAIRSGRLPPKPDIERRIRETDERVAREDAVAARRHQEWLEEMKKVKESERAK